MSAIPLVNGRRVPAGITEAKLSAARDIIEGTVHGNPIARGLLESHLTTGDDFIISLAYLSNLQALPLFDEAPRVWDQIATTKSYSTFEGAKYYSLEMVTDGFARPVTEPGKPGNVVPIVPESSPYPSFTFGGEVIAGSKLHKRGGLFSLSWERLISDAANIVPQIPGLLVQSFLDAEEWEVFNALLTDATGVANQVVGGTTVDGTTVTGNPVLSRAAIAQAITEVGARTVDGRRVSVTGGWTLVVPIGQANVAEFYINNISLYEIADGAQTLRVNGYNPLAGINVVEAEYLTGTQWFVLPKKGSTIRPVLELMRLQGHEQPEIRLEGLAGNYQAGGAISPFEGSFETDDIRFRGRYPVKGTAFTPQLIAYSKGDGSAPA